jgi:hypothetical protein
LELELKGPSQCHPVAHRASGSGLGGHPVAKSCCKAEVCTAVASNEHMSIGLA